MKNDAKRLFNNNIKVLQTTPYSLEVILNFTNGMIRAHNVMCNSSYDIASSYISINVHNVGCETRMFR